MARYNLGSGEISREPRQGILRQMFGPSRDEIWREVTARIDGRYFSGGFFKSGRVEVDVGPWTVTLDTYVESHGETRTTYTRMRAPYVNPEGFRFRVYRTTVFTGIGKFLLGTQDIQIGDPSFDEAFVIQGTSTERVRQLLGSPKIRALLQAQPNVMFQVVDNDGWLIHRFPEGVDKLEFRVAGVMKDIEQLHGLFELFAETLEELCRIGSAYAEDPGVKL